MLRIRASLSLRVAPSVKDQTVYTIVAKSLLLYITSVPNFWNIIYAKLFIKYTLLQNKRGRWFRVPPPPSFENRWRNMDILYMILKGIVWRFRFSLNFSKIFWFRDFMGKFSGNDSPMAPEWVLEKNFKLLKYEHITYSFEARNLEILNM